MLGCVGGPPGKLRYGQLNGHEDGGVHEPIYITFMKPAVLPAEHGGAVNGERPWSREWSQCSKAQSVT